MILHMNLDSQVLKEKIRKKEILFAGNLNLKIYGSLSCRSGRRMKKENRVFFHSEEEAILCGFRPCSHCMRYRYREWKIIQQIYFADCVVIGFPAICKTKSFPFKTR